MPRYYFDVRDGPRFIPDPEGLEFDSLDAAEREAAEAAAAIGRGQLPKSGAREVAVEVRDGHGQRVRTVTVSMHVDRGTPPPIAPGGSTPSETSQAGIVAAAKLLT